MVAAPQCSFPKVDIAKVVQHLRGSMTAMRDKAAVRYDLTNVSFRNLSNRSPFLLGGACVANGDFKTYPRTNLTGINGV
jgi:hypothetical protein